MELHYLNTLLNRIKVNSLVRGVTVDHLDKRDRMTARVAEREIRNHGTDALSAHYGGYTRHQVDRMPLRAFVARGVDHQLAAYGFNHVTLENVDRLLV